MTLKEFREKTSDLPEDMELFIGERLTEEYCGAVNSARVEKISVADEETEEIVEYRTVLILKED